MKYVFELKDEDATLALGKKIGKNLSTGVFFALNGDLGAGKTVFVRGLAAGLGISGRITSPTFTVMCEYYGRMTLYHFDLYRITQDDCFDAGFDDYFYDTSCVSAVEWSERLTQLPENTVTVTVKKSDGDMRIAEITDEHNLLSFLGETT